MSLVTSICEAQYLSADTRTEMCALMTAHFENVRAAHFERDLARKQWVVILRDAVTDDLAGFSTLAVVGAVVEGVPVHAFFSGDTIVSRAYWGSTALATAWLEFVFAHKQTQPASRWFWFLICKGYRTYRYLPIYFKQFHPNPDAELPAFESAVLDTLGARLFGSCYDARAKVIAQPDDYRLRIGIGDIGEREERDRRIAFFKARNPSWAVGTELACLTELNIDNLRPPARRALTGTILAPA